MITYRQVWQLPAVIIRRSVSVEVRRRVITSASSALINGSVLEALIIFAAVIVGFVG